MNSTPISLRPAQPTDADALTQMIEQSVAELMLQTYTPRQVQSALKYITGVDDYLLEDGTYFVAEAAGEIVGGGGWSRRRMLHPGEEIPDHAKWLNPAEDAAVIRAIFVHPYWARKGIGRGLMRTSEAAAYRADFRKLELLATLTGEPLYTALGYNAIERIPLTMPDGIQLMAVKMAKPIATCSLRRSPS